MTRPHKERSARDKHCSDEIGWQLVRFECWKIGWRMGAELMDKKHALKLSQSYVASHDFLCGWEEAYVVTEKAYDRTRRKMTTP